MTTQTDILTTHGVSVPPHLAAADVPVARGVPARQGDVLALPVRPGLVADTAPIPAKGIQVVAGEAERNTHLLVGDGLWHALSGPQDLGTVVVPDGGAAFLIHTGEHGAVQLAPGQWLIRRQRQQADQIELVRD
jgi:hypothetical protein